MNDYDPITNSHEQQTLKQLATDATIGIVEIGVFRGESTAMMSKVAKVPIYAIDPIIPDSISGVAGDVELIKSNMKDYKDFMFFHDFSYNVVKDFNHKFDVLFIDGSHNYDDVKKDFEDWFPKLESMGFILFHDSSPVIGQVGPQKFVTELHSNSDVMFSGCGGSITVFQKVIT